MTIANVVANAVYAFASYLNTQVPKPYEAEAGRFLRTLSITEYEKTDLKELIADEKKFAALNETPIPSQGFECQVRLVLNAIGDMLIEKNRKYGDSALSPKRLFSKASSVEQIKVRIDDKLSRMANAQIDEDEDVERDLIGYLVLLRIARIRAEQEKAKV